MLSIQKPKRFGIFVCFVDFEELDLLKNNDGCGAPLFFWGRGQPNFLRKYMDSLRRFWFGYGPLPVITRIIEFLVGEILNLQNLPFDFTFAKGPRPHLR